MTEIDPVRLKLLQDVIDIQERSLAGATMIFSGLRKSSDPEVVSISEVAFNALSNTQLVLEALIDGLTATKH